MLHVRTCVLVCVCGRCSLCHVVVGTPGRLLALLQSDVLTPGSLHMLVLDEADALLGDSFYSDVTTIYDFMPRKKQVAGRAREGGREGGCMRQVH